MRCPACHPLWKPSPQDRAVYQEIADARAYRGPRLAFAALSTAAPLILLLLSMMFEPRTLFRDLETVSGITSSMALVVGTLLFRELPVPGDKPLCQLNDPAPADPWFTTGGLALFAQFVCFTLTNPL